MSVLVKGMEMPQNCDVCPLIAEADDYHVCYINEQFIPWEWIDEHSAEQRHPKPSWCPLVEVDVNEIDEAIKALKGVRDAYRIITEAFCRPPADVVSAQDFRDCRNELCLKCGQYQTKHLGSCNGCRWE